MDFQLKVFPTSGNAGPAGKVRIVATVNGIEHPPEVLWTFRFTDYEAELQKPLTRERDLAAFKLIRGPRKLHS
jgi:hypothetical protein